MKTREQVESRLAELRSDPLAARLVLAANLCPFCQTLLLRGFSPEVWGEPCQQKLMQFLATVHSAPMEMLIVATEDDDGEPYDEGMN